jgi:hypothetical protein
MSDNKKVDIHKFITTIYNPNLNEFLIPVSDTSMGPSINEGRIIYGKNKLHLSSDGYSLVQIRDDLFHLGVLQSNWNVDYDSFLLSLEPLYRFYLDNKGNYLSKKIEDVFRSTDVLLETDYFTTKLSKKENYQQEFSQRFRNEKSKNKIDYDSIDPNKAKKYEKENLVNKVEFQSIIKHPNENKVKINNPFSGSGRNLNNVKSHFNIGGSINSIRYKSRRIRIRNSYLFLILWVLSFIIGLYLIPNLNIYFLLGESLLNASISYIFIKGVLGITHRRIERKIFSVFLILLTLGMIYQNPSFITNINTNTIKNVYSYETTYLSDIINSIKSNTYVTNVGSVIPSFSTAPISITVRVVDQQNLQKGYSGMDINLINSNGVTVADKYTNQTGYTSFNNVTTGIYKVQAVLADGYLSSYDTTRSISSSGTITFNVQYLFTQPKTIEMKYTLRGVISTIPFTVYGGLDSYLSSHPDDSVSYTGTAPSSSEITRTITFRYVDEKTEHSEISKLAQTIRNITKNNDDQVRIAVSLVQNLPYDYGQLSTGTSWKYPYEILYLGTGVCSQKSLLLVSILRELGYGCALLTFEAQNHQAVGLSCPSQYAYTQSYAFVEAADVTIITDWHRDYLGGITLPSSPSSMITICSGSSMGSISEEYNDAILYNKLVNKGTVLSQYDYNQWLSICRKYGMSTS